MFFQGLRPFSAKVVHLNCTALWPNQGVEPRLFSAKATSPSRFRLLFPLSLNARNKGMLPMLFFADVSFFDVAMALVFIGMAERLLLGYAPAEMVGPEGWLIRGNIEE